MLFEGLTVNVDKNYRTALKLSLVYSIAFSIFTCLRHEMFMTRAYDLGIFMQALWTTLFAGKFFYETPDLGISTTGSFFGVHFSPIIFILLPLYYIFPHAYTLLVLQSFLLGFAAIPLYKLGKKVLGNDDMALAFVAVYLIYPPILAANLFDFHLEAFFPVLFFYAFYFLEEEKFGKFYLTLLIALTVLDFASAILVLFTSFYASFIKYGRYIRRGLFANRKIRKHFFINILIMVFTVAYFELAIKLISMLGTKPFSQTLNWPDLGSNIYEILLGLLNPLKVLKALSYDFVTKISWLIVILLPLLFTPIFAPFELFLGLPWIAVALLSRYPPYYQLGWQYGAIYTPFLFYAAIHGFKNVIENKITSLVDRVFGEKFPSLMEILHFYKGLNKKKFVGTAIALVILSTAIGLSLRSYSFYLYTGTAYADFLPIPNQHASYLKRILSLIPSNASVLAQNNIFPHVAHRENAYVWIPPNLTYLVDFAIGDVQHPEFYMLIPNYDFRYDEIFHSLLTSGKYGVYAAADGIVLLKRNYVDAPIFYIPIERTFDHRNLRYHFANLEKKPDSISELVLAFYEKRKGAILWFGPYTGLPAGKYLLTLRLKVVAHGNIRAVDPVLRIDVYGFISGTSFLRKTIYYIEVKSGDWLNISLIIDIPRADKFEFRGFSMGKPVTIYLDLITIKQLGIYPNY